MSNIDFTKNILDTRDIILRYEELYDERQSLVEDIEEAQEELDNDSSDENETQYQNAEKALEDWIAEYQEEYESLDYIIDEVNGIDGSRYGETMINENYFHEYIKSDQEDIVDRIIDSNFPLSSYLSFDWDSYISDCQMNYMFIETKEDAYWVRG